jgi:sugar lactone lactonase YvrE
LVTETLAVSPASAIFLAGGWAGDGLFQVIDGVAQQLNNGAGYEGWLDGALVTARFQSVKALAADSNGNIYSAETSPNFTVRKVSFSVEPRVDTVAGLPDRAGSDDGIGAAASLNHPRGVATGKDGRVYVTEPASGLIRIHDPDGRVRTVMGANQAPMVLPSPADVAVGNDDKTLFVIIQGGLTYGHRVLQLKPNDAGTVYSCEELAGSAIEIGFRDGQGDQALFNWPSGITISANGTLYVADQDNHAVRQITPDGNVTTLVGNGVGLAADQDLFFPMDVAWQPASLTSHPGLLFIADTHNRVIRLYDLSATSPTADIYVGARWSEGTADGFLGGALFTFPAALAALADGCLMVPVGAARLRHVDVAGKVTTITEQAPGQGLNMGPVPVVINVPAGVAGIPRAEGDTVTGDAVVTDSHENVLVRIRVPPASP